MEGTVAADGARRSAPLTISRVTSGSILTKGNATRQAGKNKLQTEDMDSVEDESDDFAVQAQAQDKYGEHTPRLEMFWIK